jgi:hypothetical protein
MAIVRSITVLLPLLLACAACQGTPASPSTTSANFAGVWTGTLQISACTDIAMTPCREGILRVGQQVPVYLELVQTGTTASATLTTDPSTFGQATGHARADVRDGTLSFHTDLFWTSRTGASEAVTTVDFAARLDQGRSMNGLAYLIRLMNGQQAARTTNTIAMVHAQ